MKRLIHILIAAVMLLPAFTNAEGNMLPPGRDASPTTGVISFPVIRFGFRDQKKGLDTTDELKNVFSQISNDYLRFSCGKLILKPFFAEKTIILGKNRGYYGKRISGTKSDEMILSVLKKADDEIDFSRYDSDGDGTVDMIFLEFAGGIDTFGSLFWPHYALIDTEITFDGVAVRDYVLFAGSEDTNVLEHETGHLLGLPDYYGTEADEVFATNDIMNDNTGGLCGFSRWLLGWNDAIIVETDKMDEDSITVCLKKRQGFSDTEQVCIFCDRYDGPYSHFYMIEYISDPYRFPAASDKNCTELYRIFDVHAELDDDRSDFAYDNNTEGELSLIRSIKTHQDKGTGSSFFAPGEEHGGNILFGTAGTITFFSGAAFR